jgi:hypothetical protein
MRLRVARHLATPTAYAGVGVGSARHCPSLAMVFLRPHFVVMLALGTHFSSAPRRSSLTSGDGQRAAPVGPPYGRPFWFGRSHNSSSVLGSGLVVARRVQEGCALWPVLPPPPVCNHRVMGVDHSVAGTLVPNLQWACESLEAMVGGWRSRGGKLGSAEEVTQCGECSFGLAEEALPRWRAGHVCCRAAGSSLSPCASGKRGTCTQSFIVWCRGLRLLPYCQQKVHSLSSGMGVHAFIVR